jgi:hypothetical protein
MVQRLGEHIRETVNFAAWLRHKEAVPHNTWFPDMACFHLISKQAKYYTFIFMKATVMVRELDVDISSYEITVTFLFSDSQLY